MRLMIRLLFTLYILFVLFIIGVVLGCVWGLIDQAHPQFWLKALYEDPAVFWAVSIGGVVIAILSFVLMFSGSRKRKPKTAYVSTTDSGMIAVTLSALEEMTTRFISANEAVRSVKASASVRDSKLIIRANMTVAEDTNIPEALKALQDGLKAHLETLSGIEVGRILLLVEKTAQTVKARVE